MTLHERHFNLNGSFLRERNFTKDNNNMDIVDNKTYAVAYFPDTDEFVIKPKMELPVSTNGVHKNESPKLH